LVEQEAIVTTAITHAPSTARRPAVVRRLMAGDATGLVPRWPGGGRKRHSPAAPRHNGLIAMIVRVPAARMR